MGLGGPGQKPVLGAVAGTRVGYAVEVRRASYAAKRLLDVVVSATALLLLSVAIAAIALAIRLDSRGPVFYRCRRVGPGGRELWMLKFRKMSAVAEGPALTVPDDARFTRIGRHLARTKLDELPQLWNVLTGSMSLVGPRPEDPSFVELFRADYDEILRVRPGITGLTQLAFAHEGKILDSRDRVGDYVRRLLPQKVQIDRLYVAKRSTLMDLRILAWTAIAVVFRAEIAVDRSTGRLTLRRRPPLRAQEPHETEGAVTS
jgi:lipopolysaccharide/colanic/teichoic acid biosynthesis glycosyltransferase